MKILLKHIGTGLFYQGPDKWTADPKRACDFRFIDRALNYVETWGLKEVEIAFAFDDPVSVTTVPIEKTAINYFAA